MPNVSPGQQRAINYLNEIYPNEIHNVGGDCPNPKCDYQLTPQDYQNIQMDHGWFVCPKCGMSFNMYYDTGATGQPGGYTRAVGLSMTQMGQIGEQVVAQMGEVPTMGKIIQYYGETLYFNPIDFQIGPYGVEVKTIHSEAATQRFKITGGGTRSRQDAINGMVDFCIAHDLKPGLVGVRLNFYTDVADIFARQGIADTWIGSRNMPHVASVNFKSLNPYKDPSEVPPPGEMPDDDQSTDADIPF